MVFFLPHISVMTDIYGAQKQVGSIDTNTSQTHVIISKIKKCLGGQHCGTLG